MKTTLLAIALALVWIGSSLAGVSKQTLSIPVGNIVARAEADTTLGRYCTLPCPLPTGVSAREVQRAYLEMYVDVSTKPRGEYVNTVPVIEVYALTKTITQGIDNEMIEASTRAVRPVRVGSSRRVVLDVTPIVKAYLKGAAQNLGLVAGALSGSRDGDFAMSTGRLPNGAGAVLHVYLSDPGR